MIFIRKAYDRGLTHIDWLKSYHTFSFGGYYDPMHMGFGALRVINEDRVMPGMGFDTHQHRDMEIISYVISGALEHKDSLGTGSIIKPGEIQRMSAGSGVSHSEFNASKEHSVHFLQIWLTPEKVGLKPSYEQKALPKGKDNELLLIGSPHGGENVITIHQQTHLYIAFLSQQSQINYQFTVGHKGWLQMVRGEIKLNEQTLNAGDGAGIDNETGITMICTEDAEFLLFDLGN